MTKDNKVVFAKATLISAYVKAQRSDTGKVSKNKLNISCNDKDFWSVLDDVYANTPKKFVPEWYKNRDDKNMVSLKSSYDIPIRIDSTGEQLTFEEFIARGLIRGADVKVKCNVRDYSVYPSAMIVYTDGEAYDAFEGF